MPQLSLSLRETLYAERSDEVAIALVTITHPDLDAPVLLSTDPTQRITIDPLVYGTISREEIYYFVLMSVAIPDEMRGAAPRSQLILENVTSDMAKVVRSFTTPADVRIEIVTATTPDQVERTFIGMRIVKASIDTSQVTLDITREPFTNEPWPSQRMTKQRFPGLHK